MLRRVPVFGLAATIFVAAGSLAVSHPQASPAGQATPPGQSAPVPTFRLDVAYVEVDVTVRDREGRLVHDLTRDDFEITDDRERQDLALFDIIQLPVERPLDASPPAATSEIRRDFSAGDVMAIGLEIYDAVARPHEVEVTTALVGGDGAMAFDTVDQYDAGDFAAGGGGLPYQLRIPLAGMAPGSYVLRVIATSSLEPARSVARETLVRVGAP